MVDGAELTVRTIAVIGPHAQRDTRKRAIVVRRVITRPDKNIIGKDTLVFLQILRIIRRFDGQIIAVALAVADLRRSYALKTMLAAGRLVLILKIQFPRVTLTIWYKFHATRV